MQTYEVSVDKAWLSFSAAHFLVFGKKCERLHGHNYAVSVRLKGGLDDIGYLFDFTELKQMTASLCDRLDHRILLPRDNPHLSIKASEGEVSVEFGHKRFLFPEEDTLILPIGNITAELLASYLCRELAETIRTRGTTNITSVSVSVDESPGQAGSCELLLV